MNQEQAKSVVRWLIATFGPILISHGYVGSSQLEMISGVVLSAVPLVWSMFVHTESNAVAVVATIAADPASPVKGVVVEQTTAGRELARQVNNSTPTVTSPVIASAGTDAATRMAKTTEPGAMK